MKVAITGSNGFLGWHLRVRLRALYGVDAVAVGREEFASQHRLKVALAGVDTIYHLAGVNRADSDEAVETGNIEIARAISAAVSELGAPVHLVYGNSIQHDLDNSYGRGKKRAGELLSEAVSQVGGTFADVALPNLFGEHGRPHYNSFIATFCHEVAHGKEPVVTGDRSVRLLHAQRAAHELVAAAERRETHRAEPQGEPRTVLEVLSLIKEFDEKYSLGQIPSLIDQFTIDLFNTYRSHLFPKRYPFKATVNEDERGQLFETVRSHGGTGQTFVSTTNPGMMRGDHFHLHKIERFFVVQGTAEIALRRVFDDEVIRFQVKGEDRCFLDMPTMWVHNITNVGDEDLITMFWADQLLNPDAPDTYWESVEREGAAK